MSIPSHLVDRTPIVEIMLSLFYVFFFSSRRRHTRCLSDWSSDVCSSDLFVQWPGSYTPQRQLGTNAPSALVPKVICDPRHNVASGAYFNPACFAPPAPGQDGDIIWPYIKGPALDRKSVV